VAIVRHFVAWALPALLAVIVSCRSRGRGELRGEVWHAGLDRYDYLEAIEFFDSGDGEMIWGWDQAVHVEVRFRWRARDGAIEIEYTDIPSDRRTLAASIRRGEFRFVQQGPAGPTEIRCGEQLTLGESPFPRDTAQATQFYRACERSRRANS
jgi:hypothetical protein